MYKGSRTDNFVGGQRAMLKFGGARVIEFAWKDCDAQTC
jgi:hypothetical protein